MSEEMKQTPVENDVDVKEVKKETNELKNIIGNSVSARQAYKKSLDENISLNILMIGIGNAGNQTVAYASRENLDVFAINTSSRDLNDIIMDETIPCFIVGESGRGSGKNIKKGVALFKENGRNLFQSKSFIDKCQDADIIYVTSSTGGGTGPSVSPEVCRILKAMFDKKIIIYHGITPKNSDSNIAFSNTTYCLNEIKKLEIPFLLTDLERFSDDPNDVAFEKADRHVVECAKAVSGQYLTISSSQMIDENDLKSIVGAPGYMGIYSIKDITSHDLESKTMQSMLINNIKTGPAVMIQKDGISMQMGSIISCPEDMNDATKTGDYSELFQFIGHRPKKGIYENYSATDGTTGHFLVMISGMTYPINRLQEYTNVIKEQNEFLKKTKQIDVTADAELVQDLVSNSDDKLESDSSVDSSKINSVLDGYF